MYLRFPTLTVKLTQTLTVMGFDFLHLKMLRKIKQKMAQCSLRKTICMIFVLYSYGCFIYFSIDAILEFQKEKTGVHHFSTPVTELKLPVITVCPKESFKNIDSQTSKHDVLRNLPYHTYNWTDLFHSKFLENIQDWNYHEIFNPKLGVCFSLKLKQNINNTYITILKLKKDKNYQVNITYDKKG